jgi:predicted dehydrogenase
MGPGWIAERFIESVRAHTRPDIVAIGSRNKERAEEFASRMGLQQAFGDYEELVGADNLDVIYVATHTIFIMRVSPWHSTPASTCSWRNRLPSITSKLPKWWNWLAAKGCFLPKRFGRTIFRNLMCFANFWKRRPSVRSNLSTPEYGEYFAPDHTIFDPKLAGGPLLDLGTYPVSLLTEILGVPAHVVGVGQPNPRGVIGQLSAILTDASGNQGTVSTTLYGFTPTNATIVGTEETICFESPFHLPGGFTVASADGSQTLRYEEPSGRHFEGLYYEAAEVARGITFHQLESPHRILDASLATKATLDTIRRSIGIDFSATGLVE